MTPANAIRKHPLVEKANEEIARWSENCGLNRIENPQSDSKKSDSKKSEKKEASEKTVKKVKSKK